MLAALAVDPSRPRFTGYTSLGRTELSGTVLRNWAAKVAGLLVDELGAGPAGRRADPQSGELADGGRRAGRAVGRASPWPTIPDGARAARRSSVRHDPAADVDADEIFVVSGHPLGVPVGRDPRRACVTSARRCSRRPTPFRPRFAPDHEAGPLLTGGAATSLAALIGAVRAPSGLTVGQRVLTAGPWSLVTGHDPALVRLLLRPLVAGASVIHVLDLDPTGDAAAWAHRAEVERADVTIGVDVAGLRRIG